jgi:formate dehydrogenase subunit delta
MANRIGDFFEAMPDRNRAMTEIASHIRKFWEPRMRRQILEHLDAHGPQGLSEFVGRSIAEHRALIEDGLRNAASDDMHPQDRN